MIHTQIQTFKDTQYEKMKKTSSKNTYLSKYLYIYHSSHHSYIKKKHLEHEEKQNSESIVICSIFCINEF